MRASFADFFQGICISILLAGCSIPRIYVPAGYHQDIIYQPKPTSRDTVRSATYLSAGFKTHSNPNYQDRLLSGQLALSRGYVFNHFNIAYGSFLELGEYRTSGMLVADPDFFQKKYFGDFGAHLSANLFATSGLADIRYLGLEAAYSHEFGRFAQFRKMVLQDNTYAVDPRQDLFSLGLTSEIIFSRETFQFGFREFVGSTFGSNNLDRFNYSYRKLTIYHGYTDKLRSGYWNNVFPKSSFFVKIHHYYGTIEFAHMWLFTSGYSF